MADTFGTRIKHAWNAFVQPNKEPFAGPSVGASYGARPDRVRLTLGNERSAIASLYLRLALDVASADWRHIRVDQNGRYQGDIPGPLSDCLTLEGNVDQSAFALKLDIALSMFDAGAIAVVPVDTTLNPKDSASYKINTMRVGRITNWYPRHVRVRLYDDRPNFGVFQEVTLPKDQVAIIENPFYTVMNEQNSTLKRLIRKLNLLDAVDEDGVQGKLDIIIQLPYTVKHETRQEQADKRRKDIEFQLSNSKYGVAYIDGTERITQLNRPVDNNLLAKIQDLRQDLYGQLGLTQEVIQGTADEKTMLAYYNGTIAPILTAIIEEFTRKFLTKTARSQGQRIRFFRDPFKLVPVGQLAEIADKFTRNKIATSNELRAVIGWAPSGDPSADKLENSNLNQPTTEGGETPDEQEDVRLQRVRDESGPEVQ